MNLPRFTPTNLSQYVFTLIIRFCLYFTTTSTTSASSDNQNIKSLKCRKYNKFAIQNFRLRNFCSQNAIVTPNKSQLCLPCENKLLCSILCTKPLSKPYIITCHHWPPLLQIDLLHKHITKLLK